MKIKSYSDFNNKNTGYLVEDYYNDCTWHSSLNGVIKRAKSIRWQCDIIDCETRNLVTELDDPIKYN